MFSHYTPSELIWLAIGFGGQGIFAGRFLLQWIATERKRESHIPVQFWYMSIIGSLITLAYAIHKVDPVFILGQTFGSVVYIRNLYFIHRSKNTVEEEAKT